MLTRLFSGHRLLFFVGGVAFAAFAVGGFTLALLLDVAPFIESSPSNIVMSLNANLIVVAILALLIAYRVFDLFRRRRRGGGGARLQARVAFLFGLVATIPSIMLVIFSIAFLHVGLQQWFGQKVEAAVGRSVSIARAYLREHRLGLVRDTYAMGSELSQQEVFLRLQEKAFDAPLQLMAEQRGIAEIVVFDVKGTVLAKAGDVEGLKDAVVPDWAIQSAQSGDAVVVIRGGGERLRTLLWLPKVKGFVLLGRAIDPGISQHVAGVNRAVGAYKDAINERTTIEARLSILYLLFGVAFILASIWAGLMFAGALAEPISALIQTADRVRAGDLAARVSGQGRTDELGNLLLSFNRMTAQLQRQQDELITANAEMDERRQFIAAVLGGVTSGVISLDESGIIRAANRYAESALGVSEGGLIGKELSTVSPELAESLHDDAHLEMEVRLVRNGRQRVLFARASSNEAAEVGGEVITFTDITDLVAAKRQAAWSGVARRVAHEIKNPLTPIQLSAERLKRRYLKSVVDDPDVFAMCCDTIIRQVGALHRMVDEFSEFARLPTPAMQAVDLAGLCQEVIFLLEMQHKGVVFVLNAQHEETVVDCDAGQVTRALNNVMINAVHSVEGKHQPQGGESGTVSVTVRRRGAYVEAIIEDDGSGFPEDLLENVVEPYVTTKENGSGLGLAIVQRILEEHGGALLIRNRAQGGAAVEFQFLAHGESHVAVTE
ncbi:MAG: ATP-binding protein [Alphaproteobacteria bacterium]